MADRRDSSVDRQVGRGAQQPRSLRRFLPSSRPISGLGRVYTTDGGTSQWAPRMGGIQRGGEAVCWVIALVPRIAQGISPMRALSRSAKDAAAFVKEEG